MKKIKLFFILCVLTLSAWAQTLLTQNFNGNFPPSGWTKEGSFQDQWSQQYTSHAGGTVPELNFFFTSNAGTTRFVSPTINLTGKSTVLLSFKQNIEYFIPGCSVGVATRTGTSGLWTTVWSMSGSPVIEERDIVINNANTNLPGFQFCFFITGDLSCISDWNIDDISLIFPYSLDAKMASVNLEKYIEPGNLSFSGIIKNYGSTALTAFNINWKIDNGPVNTTLFTGQNITLGNFYEYSCTQQWNASSGMHVFKIWVDNPNGGNDLNKLNDTITRDVFVATQTTTSMPLFEEFTSSICGPCATFNTNIFDPWMNSHIGQFALIKYQMGGDLYNIIEGDQRRDFYEVNSWPNLFIDGKIFPTSLAGIEAGYNAAQTRPAFMSISIAPTYLGSTVSIPVNIDPYITASGLKLRIAICEKITTGNVGTNGETYFKHVLMKMVPDANGATINLTAGTPYTNTFIQNMAGTHVKEMSDLVVVVFVQDNATKQILQSVELDAPVGISEIIPNKVSIYPNPASNYVLINNAENANIQVFDVLGNKVADVSNISAYYKLDVSTLAQGTYVLKIMQNKQVISKRFSLVK